MKHLYLFLILFALNGFEGKAQEVYKMVLDNSTRTLNSPTAGFTQTQVAQFKQTALIYMRKKAFEQKDEAEIADLLNTQAYFLSEFISFFFDEILKSKRLSEDKRKKRIMLFMDASVSNPLFDDNDEETTLSFINSGGEITPFSLNTDWQKAYLAAKSVLK